MNNAPCVRFAILISPKMSENPAASRNSSPPNARLLSVWIAQYCRGYLSRFFAGGQSLENTGFFRNSSGL
jgi:hypothetical protein